MRAAAPRCARELITVGAVLVVAVGASLCSAAAAGAKGNTPKKPGAPTSVIATPVNQAIAVSWSAPPSDGGSPVTGYQATASPGKASCATGGSGSQCVITGLSDGKKYTVHVQAFNQAGEGKAATKTKIVPTDGQNCGYVGPYGNLQGCNLDDADLSNTDLSHADLAGADLNSADLDGAALAQATLTNTDLTGATLAEVSSGGIVGTPAALPSPWSDVSGYLIGPAAELTGAGLAGANLTNADLEGATLADATLTGATLADATLADVSSGGIIGTPAALPSLWSLIDGYLIGPQANLTGGDLAGANLSGANLTDDILVGADINGTTLSGANLTFISSGGVTGTPAALPPEWSLVGGYLIGPDDSLVDADLNGLDLSQTTLTGARSSGITGTPASLPADWLLVGGYLIGPDDELDFAELAGLDLTGADLAGAAISFADFTGANLTDANLTGASNIDDADMDNTIFSHTICPDGVSSDDTGGTCVDSK